MAIGQGLLEKARGREEVWDIVQGINPQGLQDPEEGEDNEDEE